MMFQFNSTEELKFSFSDPVKTKHHIYVPLYLFGEGNLTIFVYFINDKNA